MIRRIFTMPYYAVARGRTTGVFVSWYKCFYINFNFFFIISLHPSISSIIFDTHIPTDKLIFYYSYLFIIIYLYILYIIYTHAGMYAVYKLMDIQNQFIKNLIHIMKLQHLLHLMELPYFAHLGLI